MRTYPSNDRGESNRGILMRWSVIGIVLSYVVLATAEIGLHAYMGLSDSERTATIREWYFYRDHDNGKQYHMGFTVFVLPSVLMGFAAGGFGCKWKPVSIAITVVVLSIGVVILPPVYASFLPGKPPYYWPPDIWGRLDLFTFKYVFTLILCGSSAYVGWAICQSISDRIRLNGGNGPTRQ